MCAVDPNLQLDVNLLIPGNVHISNRMYKVISFSKWIGLSYNCIKAMSWFALVWNYSRYTKSQTVHANISVCLRNV